MLMVFSAAMSVLIWLCVDRYTFPFTACAFALGCMTSALCG